MHAELHTNVPLAPDNGGQPLQFTLFQPQRSQARFRISFDCVAPTRSSLYQVNSLILLFITLFVILDFFFLAIKKTHHLL